MKQIYRIIKYLPNFWFFKMKVLKPPENEKTLLKKEKGFPL